MIRSLHTQTALLYLRGHVTRSLTAAVELAQKTKSHQDVAFAEKLLKIKMASPDKHLQSMTVYKGYMNYRAHADEPIIRRDKYQSLGLQLNKIKDLQAFLAGDTLTTANAPRSQKWRTQVIQQTLSNHLGASYADYPRINAVRAHICQMGNKIAKKNDAQLTDAFAHFAKTLHEKVDQGKSIESITDAILAVKARDYRF